MHRVFKIDSQCHQILLVLSYWLLSTFADDYVLISIEYRNVYPKVCY